MKTLKLTLLLSLGAILVLVVFAYARHNVQGRDAIVTKPAGVVHLASSPGDEPVQVVEANYSSTESSLNGYSCRLRNTSGREITAIGLKWITTFSNSRAAQVTQSIDTRIHKDIAEAKGLRPIAPGEEREFRSSSSESYNASLWIKDVKVKVEFVEFADSTGVGLEDSKTYKQLISERQGASLYKNWLVNVYRAGSRKIGPVVEKLSSDELPQGKNLGDHDSKQGAAIYKKWLLDLYAASGPAALQQIMEKTN